jgi:DNA (cytosine-5)-methyltransferase 1
MKTYNVGSLFAGVGGICLGFQNATFQDKSYRLVFANEIDKYACETYRSNFNHSLIEGDINKFLNPNLADNDEERNYYTQNRYRFFEDEIDILTGGFPCQAFSIAGERRGFEDDRGNLFLSIVELIHQLEQFSRKPRILFLENVKNLISHDRGRTYPIIKAELERIGYTIKEKVINTMDYSDLPQNRERIYIIGFLNKEDSDKFTFFDNIERFKNKKSKEQRAIEVTNILNHNINFNDSASYYYTRDKYPRYFEDDGINLVNEITEENQFYQVRRGMYVRKNKSNVCPTLTANMGTGGHNVPLILSNDGIRKLTPEETFKLQGFPVGEGYTLPDTIEGRSFSKAQLYKQAGNAVSVPIITMLATELLKILD